MSNEQSNPSSAYRQTTSGDIQPAATVAQLALTVKSPPPKTVIPVIYVPGIFGSRLEKTSGDYLWDPDELKPLTKQYTKGPFGAFFGLTGVWNDRQLKEKTDLMHTDAANSQVMSDHKDKIKKDVLKRINKGKPFQRLLLRQGVAPQDKGVVDVLLEEEYNRRSDRGWFGALSDYTDLLETVSTLEHPDLLFPTFCFGYDWRQDLTGTAQTFRDKIEQILTREDYPELGDKGRQYQLQPGPRKALVVTHSMGSILSRYASEEAGARDKILGIIHLNQPTTGAPILYRRFITGTEPEKGFPFGLFPPNIDGGAGNVFGEILGNTPFHFTQMAAKLAGALQLLPTNDYTHGHQAKPKTWLKIKHTALEPNQPLDQLDIYDDIYKSERIGLIACKRYDAKGQPKPYTGEEFKRVRYWDLSGEGAERDVRLSEANPADYQGRPHTIYSPPRTPYSDDNYRLRMAGTSRRDRKKSDNLWSDFEENLDKAKTFHDKLRLQHHPQTFVIRSQGVETVVDTTLVLDKHGVLECPYERNKAGDGTVPLTSEEALLHQSAQPAGPVITEGRLVHADICGNPAAVQQTLDSIKTLVATFKTASVKTP